MWLEEPICGFRSKDVAAEAKMWLQEKSFKVIFCSFVAILVFSDSRSLGVASLGFFFS